MKYILSTLLLVSVAAILISERRPTKASEVTKQSSVDTSARSELLEGSISPSVETVSTEDSVKAAKQFAAYKKQMHEARMENMAIIKRLPKRSLPYTLDAASMQFPIHDQTTARDEAISNLIYGPNYAEYSRSVPRSYEFVAYLGLQQGHHMVVYRMASSVSDMIYPATFYLATLTDDGDLISEKEVANLESPLHIMTAIIDAHGRITSQKVNQTWQYEPKEVGYKNNKVIKSEVTATENFQIAGDGKIYGG